MKEKMHCTAIVLSAGQGKRMDTSTQKQYLELDGKPIIYYSLKAFEDSPIIDDIVLVVGEGQKEYVCEEILNKYGFSKVRAVVYGGKERYDSVWQGILALTAQQGYVFIHDGARPFVDEDILNRAYDTVIRHGACAAGMPSKDTIKLVDDESFTVKTPKRKYMWVVQTPQVFESSLITDAYSKLMREDSANVTDDAMVVEQMMKVPVKLFEGSYENIKITTPEDLEVASALLKRKNKNLGN